ncbi:hypothetical protein GGR62_003270 [Xanthomonas campestris]|nr:hypothetical protein [Xanthomonas sp. 3075]
MAAATHWRCDMAALCGERKPQFYRCRACSHGGRVIGRTAGSRCYARHTCPPALNAVLRCLLRLLLCLCLVANTATGAWASVGMAMSQTAVAAMASTASRAQMAHAPVSAAMPCHEPMPAQAQMPLPDDGKHAHAADCCKLGSCDCLQHGSLALLTLPAVPAGLPGRPALPATLAVGRSSPMPEQPVRPPIA